MSSNIVADSNVEEEEAFLYASSLMQMGDFSMVLQTATRLGLLEAMAKAAAAGGGAGGYLSPPEIAGLLKLEKNPKAPEFLERMLCLLASYSIVRCVADPAAAGGGNQRLYAVAPVCKYLLKQNSKAPSLMTLYQPLQKSWNLLTDAIVEGGIPFERAHGTSLFQFMGENPAIGKAFDLAMYDQSDTVLPKILEIYRGFEGLDTLVDIGGGTGDTLHQIVSKYPTIKGINFDLPRVIQYVPSIPGVTHVAGDMFVSVPKADAILLRRVLHDWSDEDCSKILKNCYKALPQHGKVIVAELMIPEVPDTSLKTKNACHYSMLMSVLYGAKERTQLDFDMLAKGAGFEGAQVVCCAINTYMVEFHKKKTQVSSL